MNIFCFLMFRFTQYQRMLSTLAQCEFSLGKTLMVYDMNLREMENYEKIYTNIGNKSDRYSNEVVSYFFNVLHYEIRSR